MTTNDILLYSQTNHQRGFLQQQIETDAKTHTRTLCRESLNGKYPLNSYFQKSGNPMKVKTEGF